MSGKPTEPEKAVPDVSGPTVDVDGAAYIMKIHQETVKTLIGDCVIPAAKLGKGWVMMTSDVVEHVKNEIIKQTAARMRSPKVRGQVTSP